MAAIVRWLVVGGGILAGMCIAAMTLVMGFEVFCRYLLGQPTYWALEVSTYLCVAAISLGGAYTLRENAHVGVEIVYQTMPKGLRRAAYFVAMMAGLLLAFILVRYGIREVQVAIRFGDRSLTPLAMPMAYPMSLIPLGGLLLGIQAIELILRPRPLEKTEIAAVRPDEMKDDPR